MTSNTLTEAFFRADTIKHQDNGDVTFWLGIVSTNKSESHDALISAMVANCNNYQHMRLQTNGFKQGVLSNKSKRPSNGERAILGTPLQEAIMIACLKDHSNFVPGHFHNPKQLINEAQAFLRDLQKKH